MVPVVDSLSSCDVLSRSFPVLCPSSCPPSPPPSSPTTPISTCWLGPKPEANAEAEADNGTLPGQQVDRRPEARQIQPGDAVDNVTFHAEPLGNPGGQFNSTTLHG